MISTDERVIHSLNKIKPVLLLPISFSASQRTLVK